MKNFSNLSKNAHGKRNLRGVSGVMLLTIGCIAMTTACNKKPEQVADAPSPVEQKSDSVPVDTVVEKVDSTAIKLEEFKKFTTNDLAAFMLHGKVKTMKEFSGQSLSICTFNEAGVLVKYEIGDNHGTSRYSISHSGHKLGLTDNTGTWGMSYDVRGGRLTGYECGGDGVGDRCTYSNHDANGWPHSVTSYEFDLETAEWAPAGSSRVSYSGLDEYGNWTQGGPDEVTREITYYPIQ